jgi:hypothetical protein
MPLLIVSLGGTELHRHIICALDLLMVCFPPFSSTTPLGHLRCLCSHCWRDIFLSVALADDGKFLLCARKYRRPACSEYLISLDVCDVSKGKGTYIGKLR